MTGEKQRRRCIPSVRGDQTGSIAAMLIVGAVTLVAAVAFFVRYNRVTAFNLAQVVQKMELDSTLNQIHANIRSALTNHPGGGPNCFPSELNASDLEKFRKFNNNAPTIQFKYQGTLPEMHCLLSNDDAEALKFLSVRITELSLEANSLSRKVEVMVEIHNKKPADKKDIAFVPREIKLVRTYQIRPMKWGNFGLMFHSNYDDYFVNLKDDQVSLNVFASTLFAGDDDPTWNQLMHPASWRRTMFQKKTYSRFKALKGTDTRTPIDRFRMSFRQGLETGILQDSGLANMLPKNSSDWNIRTDYHPQYIDFTYPVPEDPRGNSSAYCGAGAPEFNASRISYKVPDPHGPPTASTTCNFDKRNLIYVFQNFEKDLTIKFDSSDDKFCGLVVARTLTVEIDATAGHVYGLIGNFFVRNIVIKNKNTLTSGTSEVRIFNPADGLPLERLSSLPLGQSVSSLAGQIASLASSTAWNFYFPISKTGPFKPRGPNSYLRHCSANGTYTYDVSYAPLSDLPDFANYRSDSVGTYYVVEAL